MKMLIVLAFLWNLLAPLPPGIAVNPQTKECGYFGYWEDEYATYYFPSPWKKYYPTFDSTQKVSVIQTETGSCQWDFSDSSTESCCRQLGYAYVPGNLGKERGQLVWTGYTVILLCIKWMPLVLALMAVLFVAFLITKRKKRQRHTQMQ